MNISAYHCPKCDFEWEGGDRDNKCPQCGVDGEIIQDQESNFYHSNRWASSLIRNVHPKLERALA